MASAFPKWIYDNSPIPDPLGHGDRAVRFLRALKHPASTEPERKFQLDPWLERIVRRIYGPRHPDGSRIVDEVWLQVGRGNRKTSIAAALALLHLFGPEKVPAGQVVFAASDRAQAAIGFTEAANIIREDKRLLDAVTIYDPHAGIKTIRFKRNGSTLKAVSSDGKAQHGTTPTFILADEIHVWKGRELWEALRSGMVKRPGGLWVTATTAGRGRDGLAYDRYSYMRKIATGEIVNESILPIIFEPDEDDNWQDEATWRKSNPGLIHGYPSMSEMRKKAREAKDNPIEAYSFRQYNLNTWLGNSTAPLFNFDAYDAAEFKVDLDKKGNPEDWEADLEELPCYLGVDYAQSGDLAAIVAAWRHDDGMITIKPWFFVCGEGLEDRERLEGLPYRDWIEQGLVIKATGPIITQEEVADKVHEICARHDVKQVRFDPYRFQAMAAKMYSDGLPMLEMRQGTATMGPANGELIRAVNSGKIRHDGHEVLRHHFDGVAAVDKGGLIWMDKQDRKRGRIDGAIAASMAVSSAISDNVSKGLYSQDGILDLLGI